ncbi:MAG: pyruvate, phosphate dikinase [Candidatus Latescibacteria bacterium]|nr:pyruvate, phosphate dikinase [Candidatus Latescibacterota bacterium]NIM21621.1 pyruvate, phosphate dikinase [Candidatus Latescibacterota bacterium]NIM64600.1 pyruvate, phosphate dikinase [Candidatus Latescibacterota bacterium]NIO01115.1 pyruvate, phosphate dikinase [Candidatus Latescibacterota bacterium]NIO27508.1 pyruvate, phosphate dikinase [Candidatus Latescibacterota bacterium]
MAKKYVYFFGNGKAEGSADMRELLGGKGANIAEMTNLGIPVPAGFTITTEACNYFMKNNETYPPGLEAEVKDHLKKLEDAMGRKFSDSEDPLLVSVRSGAPASMPGMMDTVLNLGLNENAIEGLIKRTNNPRFAYDSYRRFIQMYGHVVLSINPGLFDEKLWGKKEQLGVKQDNAIGVDDLKQLIAEYKSIVKRETGAPFPELPEEQLWGAISAVFKSWNNKRAISYRRLHNIPEHWGTGVNVQAMVFGNMGDDCATGVAFTRDPATGEKRFFGEYLPNAQGEDVVAGIRTPLPISEEERKKGTRAGQKTDASLELRMPEAYKELVDIYQKLERHYKDMQDIEFTIQESKLWMLQTRNGKRTGRAAIRIAIDMVEEGLIDEKEAITRVDPDQLEQLLHPMLDPGVDQKPLAKGLPASPGAACGRAAFTVDEALRITGSGEKVVLVRVETSPEDIDGMKAAEAILTARGGMTSHAAVVARGMGKCCVVGCTDLHIDTASGTFKLGSERFEVGSYLTLDGTSGGVYAGKLPLVDPVLDEYYHRFMKWVDKHRKLRVRANADTPADAKKAREFGAEGIGLARTEHMFFKEDRIPVVREMILASNKEERLAALNKILPMQREDFVGVFEAMNGLPVTVRLLDPPLHEFLPKSEKEIAAVAKQMDRPVEEVRNTVESLHEFNPMLGHRGCRLGVTYPEIYEMQARAILEGACDARSAGVDVMPEIMIPLVGTKAELAIMREMIERVAEVILKDRGMEIPYLIGTMIEVPRAAVCADQIAEVADFFSFGTNDLTQMAYGYSRDDSGKFLNAYIEEGILPKDPFETLDADGVGELVRIAVEKGRKVNKMLKLGICGEHGGDPESVHFCSRVGLDYVSCSPFRVPVARLAAARAALLKSDSPELEISRSA